MRRIVLVGCGRAGASTAMALVCGRVCDELVLVDTNAERAQGEAMDLADVAAVDGHHVQVEAGDYSACADAQLLIVTACAAGDQYERWEAILRSVDVMESILDAAWAHGFDGITLTMGVRTNVICDLLAQRLSRRELRLIGLGQHLQNIRLQEEIAAACGGRVSTQMLGGKEDTVIPWSCAAVDGEPILSRWDMKQLEALAKSAHARGRDILSKKGKTYYAIAGTTAAMAAAILGDTHEVFNATAFLSGEYGIHGRYADVPVVLGKHGVESVIELAVSKEELAAFQSAVSENVN